MKRFSITDGTDLSVRPFNAQPQRPEGEDAGRPADLTLGAREGCSRHVKFQFHDRRALHHAAIAVLFAFLCLAWMTLPAFAQVDPYLDEGLKSHRAGKLNEAVEIYTDFLDKNPRSAEALNWRGMAYDDLNERQKALNDFKKALAVSPNYADAYNNRGEVYRKQKKFQEAAKDFQQAIKIDRNFAEAHYNLGLVNEAQHQSKAAISEFSEYLKLVPNADDVEDVKNKIAELEKAPVRPPTPRQPPKTAAEKMKAGERPGVPPAAAVKPGERPGPKPGARPGFQPPVKGVQPQQPPIPGLPKELSGTISPTTLAYLQGLGMIANVVSLVISVFCLVMLFLIARKTNTGMAWLAFIPIGITQLYLMLRIAGKPLWWFVLFFLPVVIVVFPFLSSFDPTGGILITVLTALIILVPTIALLFVCLGIASARGKSAVWGILLFLPCLNVIAYAYLGLSK